MAPRLVCDSAGTALLMNPPAGFVVVGFGLGVVGFGLGPSASLTA
jgi:hypothetical protein